jgi:CheY-like chemotaxis protein
MRKGWPAKRIIIPTDPLWSCPTALEVAEAFQPSVVLLDIGLPVMNGYEVARRLRQKMKDVRLVAMTGYGSQGDIQLSQMAGFDSHMIKPVDPKKVQHLLTTLQRYIGAISWVEKSTVQQNECLESVG